jgi:tetratricopeptide (TPR) repeat protein
MKLRPIPPGKPFYPASTDQCLCGSGLTFAPCCADRLPRPDQGKEARAALRASDWKRALLLCRADLTQYAIWHKRHTVPLVAQHNSAGMELLTTDILALSELVDDLCFVCARMGRQEEIPPMLERLRSTIADPRWQRRITYFHSFIRHSQDDDVGARIEFKKLQPISSDESDVEVLHLYVTLFGDEFSFSKRVEICDQILRVTKSPEDRIQYNCLKAFNYLLIGDGSAARQALAAGVEGAGNRDALSMRGRTLLGNALALQATLTNDSKGFDEAAQILTELASDREAWTPLGLASIEYDIGDCFRHAGKWAEAEQAYRRSLAAHRIEIAVIYLAECALEQDRAEEADKLLDDVRQSDLDRRGASDYAYAAAAVALSLCDGTKLDTAIKMLEALTGLEPYFDQRRLSLIVQLQSAEATGKREKGRWKDFLRDPGRALARYTILQPTLFGFGLNINAMIEDAQNRKKS